MLFILIPPVHGSDVHKAWAAELEVSGLGVTWDLGALLPGREAVARDALQLNVTSSGPWSLEMSGRLEAGAFELTRLHSEVEFAVREPGGADGDALLARGSTQQPLALHNQPATPPEGRELALDVAVRPSWSDPAGINLAAELSLTLSSQGESSVLAFMVEPNPLIEGNFESIRFWYWAGELDAVPATVLLTVEHNGVRIGEAEGVLSELGWNAVEWTPTIPLAPDLYTFEIRSESQRTLARGGFRVYAREGMEPLGVMALSHAASPAGLNETSTPGAHLLPTIGMEARLVSAGELRSVWEVTLVNASPIFALEVQVEICPPPGWIWVSVDAPWKSAADGGPAGDGYSVATCQTVLLGSIRGHSERSFRFTLQPADLFESTGPFRSWRSLVRPWMSFYVRSSPAPGAKGVIVHQTQVSAGAADFETTAIRGRTFIDINGSGAWEEGEPLVGGVDIVVDGVRAGRSTTSGTFAVSVNQRPRALWGRTPHGSGKPVVLVNQYDLRSLWIVDIPVPPSAVPASDRQADGFTDLYFQAEMSGGAGGGLGGVGAHLHRVSERWNLNASADIARREALTQAGIRSETSSNLAADAVFRGDAATVTAAWRRGLPADFRLGALRPSKPVLEAWSIAVEAKPFPVNGPFGLQPVADGVIEMGRAVGDLWSCTVQGVAGEWSFGNLLLVGERRWGEHVRLERKGEKAESYSQTSVGARGLIKLDGDDWPYRLDLSWGEKRSLTPSCGLTPKEGVHASLQLLTPRSRTGDRSGLLGSVTGAVSVWPQRNAENGGYGSWWHASERAFEFQVESVDLAERLGKEGALRLIPFMQFGVVPKDEDRAWSALGVRAVAEYLDHRWTLETGPKAIYDRKPSADEPAARNGRLAGSWRYDGGPVRVRLAFDRDGGAGNDFDLEGGLSFQGRVRPERVPWIGRELSFALSLDRALSESDRTDAMSISVSRGGGAEPANRLALEWKGRLKATGLAYFGDAGAYDESTVNLAISRTRPSDVASRESHASKPIFRADGWSLRMGYARKPTSIEYSQSVAAEGVWQFGTWLIELRRLAGVEHGAPFETVRSRVAWDLSSKGWGLHVEFVHDVHDHVDLVESGGRDGLVVRGSKRVWDGVDVFVQLGHSRNLPPGGAIASSKKGEAIGTREAVAAGVTLDLSKLRLKQGPLSGVPLLLTAGVEAPLPRQTDPMEPGRPGIRYFAGISLPLGIALE